MQADRHVDRNTSHPSQRRNNNRLQRQKIICLDFITVQRYANAVGLYAMAPSLPSVTSWCYSQMAKHTCIIQTTSHSSRESLVS